MKSRWTTYLLLAAVAAIWGVVVWKIAVPANDVVSVSCTKPTAVVVEIPAVDTLRLDYADPFLKDVPRTVTVRAAVRNLPLPKIAVAPKRDRVKIVHLGTVTSAGRPLYILTVGDIQYELTHGGAAGDFVLAECDDDSLYLRKDGVSYGVKLCRQ